MFLCPTFTSPRSVILLLEVRTTCFYISFLTQFKRNIKHEKTVPGKNKYKKPVGKIKDGLFFITRVFYLFIGKVSPKKSLNHLDYNLPRKSLFSDTNLVFMRSL